MFYKNPTQGTRCPLSTSVSRYVTVLPTGLTNVDPLGKGMSARFRHCKDIIFLFIINKYLSDF